MATISELAPRVLKKLMVLSPGENAKPEDLDTALEKLRAVHASLKKDDLLRWTLQDIPDFAEEPYVAMGAFLAAGDFEKPADVGLWAYGHTEIASGVHLRSVTRVQAEYF